jgi:uncharacterized membrane protein YsdA (DUF1294 family)
MSETFRCVDCGATFTLSYGHQRWFREHNLEIPKRCEDCRSRKRYANQPGMRGESGPPDEPLMWRPATRENPFLPASPSAAAPPRAPRSWWSEPLYRYGILTVGLSFALAATILYFGYPWVALAAWLIAVNTVTLAAYRYDKAIAKSSRMRVPEKVLLMLALIGGTPAALIGMWRFHHKTSKGSFLAKFGVVVLVQVMLIVVYYLFIKQWLGW